MSDFERLFLRPREAAASAPGRVNLIGEHTDYNGGFVLPAPLPQRVTVELAARPDDRVRAATLDLGEAGQLAEYRLGDEQAGRGWVDYVQGTTRALRDRGFALGGFEALVSSDLPVGSGLSSSAALDVALARALRARFALDLDDVALALLAQQVENDFVGARVGVMDPMVSSLGQPGAALFLDTRDLTFRHVPIPASMELVVVDSGTRHRHAGGEYNRRREECERAAVLLGVSSLRELEEPERALELPEPLGRRVRHVVTENLRVLAAVRALEGDDAARLGGLLDASHRSLRDDYEVSTPALDRLVELLRAQEGLLGARLTGGGFGGSVLALARPGAGAEGARRAAAAYAQSAGREARVLLPVEAAARQTTGRPR